MEPTSHVYDPNWTIEGGAAMTPDQFRRAFRLAVAYGHEWAVAACRLYGRELAIGRLYELTGGHPAAIEEALGEVLDPAGIQFPTINAGDVVHETMTGRTFWRIVASGDVVVEIGRPEVGCVIRTHVRPDHTEPRLEIVQGHLVGARHIDALAKALAATGWPHYGVAIAAALVRAGHTAWADEADVPRILQTGTRDRRDDVINL